jgi:hypothetical protein
LELRPNEGGIIGFYDPQKPEVTITNVNSLIQDSKVVVITALDRTIGMSPSLMHVYA